MVRSRAIAGNLPDGGSVGEESAPETGGGTGTPPGFLHPPAGLQAAPLWRRRGGGPSSKTIQELDLRTKDQGTQVIVARMLTPCGKKPGWFANQGACRLSRL